MVKGTADPNRLATLFGAALVLSAALPALAVDGVIEINQVSAEAGGVTPGDTADFPVLISQRGSYRLTSDLIVPPGITGIDIESNDVTLDLNGFSIIGGGEVGFADGIGFATSNVEIRHGTIRGFLRHGIFGSTILSTQARVIQVRAMGNFFDGIRVEGAGALVDGCTASGNFANGFYVIGNAGLVLNSVAQGNTLMGLFLGLRTGYRSNGLTDNNGGNANPQVSNGLQLGTNLCGLDTICP